MTILTSGLDPALIDAVRAGRMARSRRRSIAIAVLIVVLLALLFAELMLGNTIYPLHTVWGVIRGEQIEGATFTIGTLRIPRLTVGLLAGLAFGAAGTTFQTMLRNPLASPDVIGISSGASAAAVISLVVLHWNAAATTGVALIAGVMTALVIYLAARSGASTGGRLILIGIGVGAMLDSVVSYTIQRAAEWDVAVAMRWLTGSLNGPSWGSIWPLACAVVVLIPLIVVLSRELRALELGDASATALGVRVDRARMLLLISAVALVCFATAATGPIAFVAFLAGPIAARLVGAGRSLTIPAALLGACLVLAADLLGQFAFATTFPVGVITGILGAPYLLYLLIRTSRRGGSS
ncbi:MAG: iron chelate uptake ABC transporter family permease subunit [Microbacterium sp.]